MQLAFADVSLTEIKIPKTSLNLVTNEEEIVSMRRVYFADVKLTTRSSHVLMFRAHYYKDELRFCDQRDKKSLSVRDAIAEFARLMCYRNALLVVEEARKLLDDKHEENDTKRAAKAAKKSKKK